ncbi:MAG: SgcJ/EcaC family oxidoreductase [Gemmatales bacterium]
MRYRKLFCVAFFLAMMLGLNDFPVIAVEPQDTSEATGQGKRTGEFIEAYNKGDAKALAAFWTSEATYVDQAGLGIKGRAALEKMYGEVFAAQPGAKLKLKVTSAQQITPDVAMEDGVSEVTPAGGGIPSVVRFSTVLVKKEGQWYFLSVRESAFRPPSNGAHFQDLELLIGGWVGEADKGESATASYSWAENQNFIVSNYSTTLNNVPVTSTTQWIAWDAVEKRVRSWSFYSGGGIGESTWAKEGNKWALKVAARMANGKKVSVTHVLTLVDNNHITWQPTELIVDDHAQPDRPVVKLRRARAEAPVPNTK